MTEEKDSIIWMIFKATLFNPTVLISLFFPLVIALSYNRLKLKLTEDGLGDNNNWIKTIMKDKNFDAILDQMIQLSILTSAFLFFFLQFIFQPLRVFKDYTIVQIKNVLFSDVVSCSAISSSFLIIIIFAVLFIRNKFSTLQIFEGYKQSSSDDKLFPPRNLITAFRGIIALQSALFNLWIHHPYILKLFETNK